MAGNDSEEALTALMSRKTAISLFEGKALGLDKAILHSIDCCCKHASGGGEIAVKGAGSSRGVVVQSVVVHSEASECLPCACVVRCRALVPDLVGDQNKSNCHTNVKLQLLQGQQNKRKGTDWVLLTKGFNKGYFYSGRCGGLKSGKGSLRNSHLGEIWAVSGG